MTTELRFLLFSCFLGLVHVLLTGLALTREHGLAYGLSSRDEDRKLTGMGGRLSRACSNFLQTFPFFAAAVLSAQMLDRHGTLTVVGAHLYFWGRLAFLPLYAFDVVGIRTAAWVAALWGIVFVLAGLM